MKKLKIAIAQMNPVAGDVAGNAAKILEWSRRAETEKSNLVVFPEMALCGYPIWDLANHPDFAAASAEAVKKIAVETKNLAVSIVFGGIESVPSKAASVGGRLKVYNSLFWIENGRVLLTYRKRLLPTYDVFLEDVFFQPGNKAGVVKSRLGKVGVMICEDLWDDSYDLKPLAELKKAKPDFVINLSASPYYAGVRSRREELLARQSKKYKLPIVYVNQTGAQDDLIFDGASMVYDKAGKKVFQAPAFEEGLYFFEPAKLKTLKTAKENLAPEMYRALVLGVKDYFRKNGFKKAVIGLSGGIDSALVAAIAVDALGADAVRGITMPSQYSSEGSWKDSMELAKNLGIQCRVYPIQEKFDFVLKQYREQKRRYGDSVPVDGTLGLAVENLQARLRGLELMFISNDEGSLVLTTGNKSELAMGYCTLYGDMCGGLAVLGDVYKTQVYALCRYRNSVKLVIPEAILTKAPSAELRPNQKDQDSLPEYDVLDEILRCYIEKNMSAQAMIKHMAKKKIPAETVLSTLRKTDLAEYKRRQTPPILRVTEKAWFGRRMPITNRFVRNA
ncbi:MAG TPA: NAD+ synthase [Candidatus Omnitrophota bacterium]|nr:NAD+ synthase [Candidatus Omnitrophota bacterium]